MFSYSIDINADVGEGVGNEAQLMPFLSSCNIACGGHAGDQQSMRQVVKLALEHRVKIGAHPSYPDPENFGRKDMSISCAALYGSIKGQIISLIEVLREFSGQLHHVKPHGALYNKAAADCNTADVIIEAVKSIPVPLKLYVPYNSVIADRASAEGIKIVYEGFADRNYNRDLSLVSRSQPYALITDPDEMLEHVMRMIALKKVRTVDGAEVPIHIQTLCVHGDNPEAISLLENLYNGIEKTGVKIR